MCEGESTIRENQKDNKLEGKRNQNVHNNMRIEFTIYMHWIQTIEESVNHQFSTNSTVASSMDLLVFQFSLVTILEWSLFYI